MKKWIYSTATALLLTSTAWSATAKAEPLALIAGYQSVISLQLAGTSSIALELKTGDHTERLSAEETDHLIEALDRLLSAEIEPGFQNAFFNLPPKLRIEKDITQPENRQYTLYNGDIETDGTQAWLSKYELLELRRVLVAVQARVREI